MFNITSPQVLYIIETIKKIQKRMKESDLINSSYIEVYDTITKEFSNFSDNYTSIMTSVVKGENLNTIASILYYKDLHEKGLITEAELADSLAKKYKII